MGTGVDLHGAHVIFHPNPTDVTSNFVRGAVVHFGRRVYKTNDYLSHRNFVTNSYISTLFGNKGLPVMMIDADPHNTS